MSLQGSNEDEKQRLEAALSRISSGKELVEADKEKDKLDVKADKQLDKDARQAAVTNDWLLIGLRKAYGYNLIFFMWVYFVVTFLLIVLNAYGFYGIRISDNILAAAIGGTAVSVLGVVGTIASGLFKPPEKK